MPVDKLLEIILSPVYMRDDKPFWHHLGVYDSHRGAIGEVLTARMQAGHHSFEELLVMAAYPAIRKSDAHYKDCHDCRSEVGWLVSQLPNYSEYGSIRP